jgi:hypothetical protein
MRDRGRTALLAAPRWLREVRKDLRLLLRGRTIMDVNAWP